MALELARVTEWRAAAEVGTEQAEETAGGIEQIGTVVQETADDIQDLEEAFADLFEVVMGLDRAQIAYRNGLREMVEELEDGTRTLGLSSQAGRDNREAVLDQIEAISDLREANVENGMSIEEANAKYDKQLDKIADMLIERGFEEEAVRDLIDSYRDIPDQVSHRGGAARHGSVQGRPGALQRGDGRR